MDDANTSGPGSDPTAATAGGAGLEARGSVGGAHPGSVPGNLPRRGDRIGAFVLLEAIGEGGFGTVWLAERRSPMVQRVAIKIIKPGMDSKAVVARFEQERQALAVMDHPNVAKVFDGGITDRGLPYFVMEYVAGEPITRFCDRNRYTIRQRLELFASVCDAVQHAHRKGIIHRDLKPANVLIEEIDGRPVCKVIDFGIAKAIHRAGDEALVTRVGSIIGTPEYMSPEQADGASDIDTRTDVYSLGVMLYELLVGRPPWVYAELGGKSPHEFGKVLREKTPPSPSAILNSGSPDVAHVAMCRSATVGSLMRQVVNELEWIPLRAIRKEPERRYDSPAEFAEDVRRYLRGEALMAAPDSRLYLARKFVVRNRFALIASAALAISLVAGLVSTAMQAREAALQRDEARKQAALAEERSAEAERERAGALSARAAEKFRADQLALVAEFQADMLGRVDPAAAGRRLGADLEERWSGASEVAQLSEGDREVARAFLSAQIGRINLTDVAAKVLRESVLEPSEKVLDERFGAQPEVDAALRQTLAGAYRGLGIYEAARSLQIGALELRRRALGPGHPATLESTHKLGIILQAMGEYSEAARLYERALSGRREVLGALHRDTLASAGNLAAALEDLGDLDGAEQLCAEVLRDSRRALGDEDPDTLVSWSNLANLLYSRGKAGEAEPHFRAILEATRRALGDDHPDTLVSINNEAMLLRELRRFDEAETLLRESLSRSRSALGEEHASTLRAAGNLALLLHDTGRNEEAEVLMTGVLRARRRVLGVAHPDTLNSIGNMGVFLSDLGRREEALPFYEEALCIRRDVLGDRHRDTLLSMNNLAALLVRLDRSDEAEPLLREALAGRDAVLGDVHPETIQSAVNLATILTRRQEFTEAITLLEAYEAAAGEVARRGHTSRLPSLLIALARAHRGSRFDPDHFRQAEILLVDAHACLSVAGRPVTECAGELALLYAEWDRAEPGSGRDAEAERWRAREAQGQ